jgi:phosphoserine phosphatase
LENTCKKELGIDYVHANELEIIDGKLTGNYLQKLSMVKKKAELQAIADKEGIHINQTIVVGDGANDLPMLNFMDGIASCQTNQRKSRKFYF